MPEYLKTTIDKFTFRVAVDRLYTDDGVWLQLQGGGRARLGVTDYLQQHSGDVAFISVKPRGTCLIAEEEFAALETVKVTLGLPSPIEGTVVDVNESLECAPERVNQDPYGEGWLAVIEPAHWDAEQARLLDPSAYLEVMRSQAEAEVKEP